MPTNAHYFRYLSADTPTTFPLDAERLARTSADMGTGPGAVLLRSTDPGPDRGVEVSHPDSLPITDERPANGATRTFEQRGHASVRLISKSSPYFILAISVVPILVGYAWILLASFTVRTEGFTPIGGLTLKHWRFLDDPVIWRATLNSVIIAILTVVIVTVVASLAAYALSRIAFKGRRGFMSVTLVLNAFRPEMLLIAIFQVLLFIGGLPIIGEFVGFNSLLGVALILVTLELPLAVWVMKGFMDTISWDVERSAMIDGASRYQIWREIILPQIRPGLAALAILMFIEGWNAYLIPQLFTIGTRVSTLSVLFNQFSSQSSQQAWNGVAAVGMFQLVPILIFFLFTQKSLLNIYGPRGRRV